MVVVLSANNIRRGLVVKSKFFNQREAKIQSYNENEFIIKDSNDDYGAIPNKYMAFFVVTQQLTNHLPEWL